MAMEHSPFASSVPWQVIHPLGLMLERQPTLVVGEAAFIALALTAFCHAAAHGRQHMLLWLGALLGGTANDVFFMMLPFVDNFWHAQCTFMLTPRLPLYILGVYISFIYVPVAASWRLPQPALVRFVASALTAGLLYAPFDVTGAKFLWWTWHDTDAAVQVRWLGVPVGSTMFTITHTFCFHALLHVFALRAPRLEAGRFAGTLLALCLLGTPAMMVGMGPWQLLQLRVENGAVTQLPGRPDLPALALELLGLVIVGVIAHLSARHPPSPPPFIAERMKSTMDLALWVVAVAYFVALALVMALGDPAAVVAEGVHQTYGKCRIPDFDLSK